MLINKNENLWLPIGNSISLVSTQESRNFVRGKNRSYINDEGLTIIQVS